jgi:hypothetical protein
MFFDGVAVGLAGTGQKIEAFTIVPDGDSDGFPDGIDNCPETNNPPSICGDEVTGLQDPNQLCPSGLSSECPPGFICVQPDEDADGVGDPCDQCNGRDDAVCFCGDGILDVPSEQCDLGAFNQDPNHPDSLCTAECRIQGSCTNDPLQVCTVAEDCSDDPIDPEDPNAPGCCGNGTQEGEEECDDGNPVDDDLCTNACLDNPGGGPLPEACGSLVGPNIVQALVKPMKLSSKVAGNDLFEKWLTAGDFNLADGVTFDPFTQDATVLFSQEVVVFEATLPPASFLPIAPSKWKFKDKEGDIPGAETWTLGVMRLKDSTRKRPLAQLKFKLKGRGDKLMTPVSIPIDPNGLGGSAPLDIRIRQSIIVGTTCATRLVTCEQKSGGKLLKCFSAFQP